MAGDWIKMRADLFTHPKVVRISSALKADTLRTVGGLMSVWCLFDAHSEDGHLSGYEPQTLDDHLRWPGFAAAMQSVQWLVVVDGEGLELPRFDSHNGQSAKRRAQEADRKRGARKSSAPEADTKRTREEKRREEKETTTSQPDGCPHQQIVDLYHELLPANPRIKDWTGKRQANLRSRWREDPRRQSLDYWERFLRHVAASPFLTGQRTGSNGRPFLPGLDWLVLPENFAKVIEGRYHEREIAA